VIWHAGVVAGAEITVVLVDDHPVVRDGVTAALRAHAGIVVVGEAGSAREGVDIAVRLRPAVVLVDLHLPGGSGVAVIRELGRVHAECRCLVLTLDDDDESLFAAMAAGARGYLLKGARGSEIAGAIRAAAAGELVFGAGVAERVAGLFSAPRRPRGAGQFPGLTDRELVLLDLVARGLDNTSIARTLHLAPKTVRNQLSALTAKLGVPDRPAAAALARRAGLGQEVRLE
jgi:DNA-binding NarL/FixJ family response regulator